MSEKERKLLGENLDFEDKISLAQLTVQPGWNILVKLMGEACRQATEEAIKLEPDGKTNFNEILASKQATARAMSKFAKLILDSIAVIRDRASKEAKAQVGLPSDPTDPVTRFRGWGVQGMPKE